MLLCNIIINELLYYNVCTYVGYKYDISYVLITQHLTQYSNIFITFSNELSGGRLAGIGGRGLIGVDISVEDDTSTTWQCSHCVGEKWSNGYCRADTNINFSKLCMYIHMYAWMESIKSSQKLLSEAGLMFNCCGSGKQKLA